MLNAVLKDQILRATGPGSAAQGIEMLEQASIFRICQDQSLIFSRKEVQPKTFHENECDSDTESEQIARRPPQVAHLGVAHSC